MEPRICLKEEVAILDGRLRSQEEQIAAEIEMAQSVARAEAAGEWEKEL